MENPREIALVTVEQLLLSPACGEADRNWASFLLSTQVLPVQDYSVMSPDSRQVLFARGIAKMYPGEKTILILDGPLAGFICCDLTISDHRKLLFEHNLTRQFPGKLGVILKYTEYLRHGITCNSSYSLHF
ncbi:MAG: hypothetical protein ABIE03_04445 [Patescibacteria group bacterium]|nr:hypothetical protein [Patescibacteria group bacterium]